MQRFWVVSQTVYLHFIHAAILPNGKLTWASQSIMAKTLEIQIPEMSTADASMGSFTLGRSTSALISCLYSELCSMKSSHPPVRGSSALSTISTFLWSLIISLYLLISFQRSSYLFRLQRRCRLPSLLFGNTGWCPRQGRPVSYQP